MKAFIVDNMMLVVDELQACSHSQAMMSQAEGWQMALDGIRSSKLKFDKDVAMDDLTSLKEVGSFRATWILEALQGRVHRVDDMYGRSAKSLFQDLKTSPTKKRSRDARDARDARSNEVMDS